MQKVVQKEAYRRSLKYKSELVYFEVAAVLLILGGSGCVAMRASLRPVQKSEPVITANKDAPRLDSKPVVTTNNDTPRPIAEEENVVAMVAAAASRANDAAVRANAAAKRPQAAATKAQRTANRAAAYAAEAKKAARDAQAALRKAFLILMSVGR